MPFEAAADDLRSRLYNLLHNRGLAALRAQEPPGRYATETLFLLARFFAWEQQLLRFTYLAGDRNVVDAARNVRKVLASDAGGLDPWCLFRTTQTALGQSVLVWRNASGGFADTLSVVEFERQLMGGLAYDLGLEKALDALKNASVVEDLDGRTLRRLEDLRVSVEALLAAVADHQRQRHGGVSVVARSEERPS